MKINKGANMRYKLMMCGFSAVCEDMQEVRERLALIPTKRAELESSACYVFDTHSGARYEIYPSERGWIIQGLEDGGISQQKI